MLTDITGSFHDVTVTGGIGFYSGRETNVCVSADVQEAANKVVLISDRE